MSTPPKASLLAFRLVLFTAAGASAQAPAAAPPSSAGIYPLASVRAGQHGTAYTVFQGVAPEPFGVDILGVLHNALGPGEDLILGRLTGAKAEYTGVVAGMSGSPVYIEGKLVGALAFRIGEFSKEPIAGITPIGEMLPVRDADKAVAEPDASAAAQPPLALAASSTSSSGEIAAAAPGLPGSFVDNPHSLPKNKSIEIQPIETPLVFSGFSPAALDLWRQHAPALGLEPTAGLGGSGAPGVAAQPPLAPGSAVSALMVSGDMEIAATCTVTYLDAGHLLACGHPLTQFGAVSLPMTKAEVVATLASPAGSFKIVNTGEVVGAFTQDRQTAIGGRLGIPAQMIPVTIAVHAADGTTRTLHLQVLDQAQVTPTAMLVSLFQALQQTPAYAEEDSYQVHATVSLAGFPPAEIRTLAVPGGFGSAAIAAALTLGLRFNTLYSSTDRRTAFTGVTVEVTTLPGRRAATLTRAVLERTPNQGALHAGDQVTVAATVTPYRGPAQLVRLPIQLPAALPDGELRLLVSDGAVLDRLLAAGRVAGAVPLAGTIEQLNALHADDRLYVTLLRPDAELNVDGRTLDTVPLSLANQLVPAHERERSALHGESAQPLASIPVHANLSGEQILMVRVE